MAILPELLKLENGEAVTTAEQWWKQRRPEIVESFEREILGRIPADVPTVKWEVKETRDAKSGDIETVQKAYRRQSRQLGLP